MFKMCLAFYAPGSMYLLSPLGTSKAQQESKAIREKSTKQNEHLQKPGKGVEAEPGKPFVAGQTVQLFPLALLLYGKRKYQCVCNY